MLQYLITQQHYFVLKLFSALGCGLIAGVFFAFSTFVMNALARLQPAQGITAMQSINITVINPLFMAVFLGTAAACILLTKEAREQGSRGQGAGGERFWNSPAIKGFRATKFIYAQKQKYLF
ncbi:anthrone oxygenase family protein [Nostoc sp.]|uniref:anthrone oxygenase family protein n=1 Tax=Nostoc sp. TaxID=1180 RepID=UPI002FF8FE8D